jgi:phosphoribosylanthranilate isomerase
MRIKICGLTNLEQARAIADLGATAIGFICVSQSPRYVQPSQIKTIIEHLPAKVDRIGVFANASLEEISAAIAQTGITGVQLHGDETPEFCQQLKQRFPEIERLKALRIRTPDSLSQATAYFECVDTLLLDAYHPHRLGGTGKTLDWTVLQQFNPPRPWLLAGGLTPDNILEALNQLHPSGIDLSSGVERSPGDKDLKKVAQLFEKLQQYRQ